MEKKEELMELFEKNSEKMLENLKKGADIIIKKNKEGFIAYSNLIKKIK